MASDFPPSRHAKGEILTAGVDPRGSSTFYKGFAVMWANNRKPRLILLQHYATKSHAQRVHEGELIAMIQFRILV